MHTLLIRSHTLLIRYAYGDKRYTDGDLCCYTLTYVGKRYSYATHTLLIRRLYVTRTLLYATHTFVTDRRRKRGHQHSTVVRMSSFFRNFHTQLIRSFIRCSVTAPLSV